MSRCRGCGNTFRKGRRVSLLGVDGTLTPAIVCLNCAGTGRALRIVAPFFGCSHEQTPAKPAIDGRELLEHVRKSIGVWKRGTLETAPSPFQQGRHDALEAVEDLIAAVLRGRPL